MSKKKQVLFMHQNFPGQYRHLAPALNENKNYEVSALSINKNHVPNIKQHFYTLNVGNNEKTHRLALEFEAKMIRAEAAALRCIELKKEGISPDVIISHPGWGETLFVKEVWPKAKIMNYFEFYYNTTESDVDFDKIDGLDVDKDFDMYSKLIARNQPLLMSYSESDALIAPTKFQASVAPEFIKKNIHIIHDGIDTNILKPYEDAFVTITKSAGLAEEKEMRLTKKDKIITFVNRTLEPYRGYHIFMRSLPKILEKHPDAYVLIIGGKEGVSYGANPPDGTTYKDMFFNEVKEDLKDHIERIKFLGRVDYRSLLSVFAISSAHIYFTYPFVLSWSMLEAMAMGCLIIGSKTEPVEEVIKDKVNGLLVDFHDHKALAEKVDLVLKNQDDFIKIRKKARETIVKGYDLKTVCLPKQVNLVESLL